MNALLIVDVQQDFLRGSLAVPNAEILPNKIANLSQDYELVIATRDWHPSNHMSFLENGGQWPKHCVAGDPGSRLHPSIDRISDIVISKGTESNKEAYSGFSGTLLGPILKHYLRSFDPLTIVGVATDYCVKETALDAFKKYWLNNVIVKKDFIAGVSEKDSEDALEEMLKVGIKIE